MAYGFNGDRSKYDLSEMSARIEELEGQLEGKFVVISGNLTNVQKGENVVSYTEAQLEALGIDDIDNYVVVGAMARTTADGWMNTYIADSSTAEASPYVRVSLGTYGLLAQNKRLKISVYSKATPSSSSISTEHTTSYRVVLMKIA